jgi:hypothetical protein
MKEVHMPVKSLPSNPSLEHLKYQARDLLNAVTRGNPEAVARTREFHPRFARMSDDEIRTSELSLADAQLVIAREYGFESWPRLKYHVEVSAQTAAPIVGSLPGFKPPTGPVELKQKWPAGARIVKESDLKQNMEIYLPGKADPVKQELSLLSQYAYTVIKELPGGGREVELQHLSFHLEIDTGGYLWRYDSARSSATDQSPIAKVFKMILREKIRCYLDAGNQVERMEGVDELMNHLNMYEGAKLKPGMTWDNQELDKVLERIYSGTPHPLENASPGLKKMFSEEYFKSKFDSFFPRGKAVQPGDSWAFSRESIKNNRSLQNVTTRRDGTVTFRSWDMRTDRLCACLDFHGTSKTSPQVPSEAAMAINPIIEGTFSGVVWFDPELGRGIEVNANHDFKVTSKKITMPTPYTKLQVQPATDHHHQVITEKLVSVT